MKILMVGFSKTGNTYMFMDYLKQFNSNIEEYRFNIKQDVDIDISPYDLIIVGTNTWGDGRMPPNCKQFIIDNALKYKKDWIVFGTGNSIFANFCGAVDGAKKILNDTGNSILQTFKYEQRFIEEDLDLEDRKIVNDIVDTINP